MMRLLADPPPVTNMTRIARVLQGGYSPAPTTLLETTTAIYTRRARVFAMVFVTVCYSLVVVLPSIVV